MKVKSVHEEFSWNFRPECSTRSVSGNKKFLQRSWNIPSVPKKRVRSAAAREFSRKHPAGPIIRLNSLKINQKWKLFCLNFLFLATEGWYANDKVGKSELILIMQEILKKFYWFMLTHSKWFTFMSRLWLITKNFIIISLCTVLLSITWQTGRGEI